MSSLGSPELRRIRGCHARLSLGTPRAFRDAARTSCLVRRRLYSHVGAGGGGRLLTGLESAAASGRRGRCRLPTQGPHRRSPSRSGNHRHRASGSGSRDHHSHRPGVHRRACSRATIIVTNESGWGVKN
jgi:hypothetical protein